MKYVKFIINNYKGIPKIELDLSKKPSSNIFTLVGLNESGKTSILEAIYLFQNDIPKKEAHTLILKSRQYSFNGTISVEAELELEDEELNFIKGHLQKKYKFQLTEAGKTIKIEKKYSFERSAPLSTDDWNKVFWTLNFIGKTKQAKTPKRLRDWKKEAWDDVVGLIKEKYLPKILYYQDFLFKFPEKIYLEPLDKEGAEQEEYRDAIQDILDSIENGLTTEKDLLERMKNKEEKSHKEALNQLLLKMSSKLDDEILKKWDEIFGGTWKKKVNVSCDSETDEASGIKHFIELKIEQGSDSYSINDRSLGFRWFFSFFNFYSIQKISFERSGGNFIFIR